MRRAFVILPLLLLSLSDCTTTQRGPVSDSGVEPLREADFDRLTSQLADHIISLARRHKYGPPALITIPRIEPGSVERPGIARAFARRLGEGLNDRMRGAAVFTPAGVTVPDMYSSLRFAASPRDPKQHAIVFRVIDHRSRQELLARTFSYQPFRPAPVARSAPSQNRNLDIDAAATDIGKLVLKHAPALSDRTVTGRSGRVMFLGGRAWKQLRLLSQRTTRLGNDLLRVELNIRARRQAHDAELRLIFYDDEGNPVSVTPVVPFHFLPDENRPLAVVSAGSRARRYVCLIADN
jgi:hypothetical protein